MINVGFFKIEASGNDFVLIDNLKQIYNFSYSKFAKIVCDRHRGIGADGLLVLEPSSQTDFKMRYLNSDGSEGGMCGNGGRAIASFASKILGKNIVYFEALNHVYSAQTKENFVKLLMKNPDSICKHEISYKSHLIPVWSINTGAPHTVIFWEDLSFIEKKFTDFEIIELGRYVRFNKLYKPDGTNVNIVNYLGKNILEIRTYERGVENETLSCGTGSIASAIIVSIKFQLIPPIKIIPLSNDELIVDFKNENGLISNVTLEGKVNIVYRGEFKYNEIQGNITLSL